MAALTCTPSSLLASTPCFQCLSTKELKAVILYAFATAAGHTITQALDNSACFTCMGDKQKLVALTTLLAQIYLEDVSIETIKTDIKCLECASESQVDAATLNELCQGILT